MAKQERNATSPFWKPRKKGDQIEGTFEGFEMSTPKGSKDELVNMKLDTGLVTMSSVLKSFFKPVWKQLRAGKTKVKIVFIGLTDKKYAGGNKAKLYTVIMDGKELKQSFAGRKAEEKQLTKFFA